MPLSEHRRLAATIKTRDRSKTRYRKKESPYQASNSSIYGDENASCRSNSIGAADFFEESAAQMAYHSFTSQHEICETYHTRAQKTSLPKRHSLKKQRSKENADQDDSGKKQHNLKGSSKKLKCLESTS